MLLSVFQMWHTCKLDYVTKNYLLNCREYVQRAFASVSNEGEKDRVEAALKEKIEQAFNEGSAMTKDWSQEPLPLYVLVFCFVYYSLFAFLTALLCRLE